MGRITKLIKPRKNSPPGNPQRTTTDIVDLHGNPYRAESPPQPPINSAFGSGNGDGGGIHPLSSDLGAMKKNVSFLNWALGIIFISGLSALVGLYLSLSTEIDSRYDRISDKMDNISDQIGEVKIGVGKLETRHENSVQQRNQSEDDVSR